MKAISLWEPWAMLVVLGEKGNETRGWATSYRGKLAIHAAKKPIAEILMLIPFSLRDRIAKALSRHLGLARGLFERLPLGEIVGTVDLVDCVPVEWIRDGLSEQERAFGDYSDGRYAWRVANPVRFERPIPARGAQGLWNWEGCRDDN